jgi:Tol biopolymer transport system component
MILFTVQVPKKGGGSVLDIFSITRQNKKSPWQAPQKVPFSSAYLDNSGVFFPVGNRFYFWSRRPVPPAKEAREDTEIWYVDKTAKGWGEPVNIGPPVNSDKNDGGPSFAANGTMYFHSSRGGNEKDGNIYRSKYSDGKFTEPEKLSSTINTTSYEAAPFIAPDESYLLFYRIDFKDTSKKGLMLSFPYKTGEWTTPVNLKNKLPLKSSDLLLGGVSPDGKYLFILDAGDIYWLKTNIIEQLRPKE